MRCTENQCKTNNLPLEYDGTFCSQTQPLKHYISINKISEWDISCLECTNGTVCTICDTANEDYRAFNDIKWFNEDTKLIHYPKFICNLSKTR